MTDINKINKGLSIQELEDRNEMAAVAAEAADVDRCNVDIF